MDYGTWLTAELLKFFENQTRPLAQKDLMNNSDWSVIFRYSRDENDDFMYAVYNRHEEDGDIFFDSLIIYDDFDLALKEFDRRTKS